MTDTTVCAVCHRNSTPETPLIVGVLNPLNSFNGRIIRRNFGDRNGMKHGAMVCALCDAYVCPRRKSDCKGSWLVAWPATIWTCLSVPGYAEQSAFLRFLPQPLRQAWDLSVESWDVNMRLRYPHVSPAFRDVTKDVYAFNSDIDSGHMGRIRKRINDNPYPVVRCPQGCFKFVDDLRRKTLKTIPAVHYLAICCPSLRSFGADSSVFKGARPDWTNPVSDLDWIVTPCLIQDEKDGLCILACSQECHSSSSRQWLHVPTNPVLDVLSPLVPDVQAPVILSGNCVRSGRTNHMNTSFPVYEQTGSTVGLSTFRLSPRSPHFQMNDHIALAMGLVYENRPDILHLCKQSHGMADTIDPILDFYSKHRHGRSSVDVRSHCASGSYIHLEDAYIMAQTYNRRLNEEHGLSLPTAEGDNVCKDPKDLLAIVHVADGRGHRRFIINMELYHENHPNGLGPIAYSIINVLVHSSHVYEAVLNSKWSRQDRLVPLYKSIVKAVQLVVKSDHHSVSLPRELREHLRNGFTRLAPNGIIQSKIGLVLQSLSVATLYMEDASLNDVRAAIDTVDHNILVIKPSVRPLQGFPDVLNNDWTGMLGISIENEFRMTWRWTSKTTWQYFGTEETQRAFGKHNLLIYVRCYRSLMIQKSLQALCSGQSIIRCRQHEELLIRESRGVDVSCALQGCSCKIQWRCAIGYGEHQCSVGVCRKHFQSIIKGHNSDEPYLVGECGLREASLRGIITEHHAEEGEAVVNDEIDDDAYQVFMQGFPLNPDIVVDDAAVDDTFPDVFPCPMTTNVMQRPIYTSKADNSSAGHYLLNHHLRVMTRTGVMKKPPVTTLQLLQNICNKEPHGRVSLLYPEGMLFPRIFWAAVDESVVGALPSVMYNNVVTDILLKDTASVKDHLIVRLHDGSLLTSHDHNYIQFAFDVLLNRDLNRNSAVIACNRGLEAVVRNGARFYPEAQEDVLKFDDNDSRREVNRLLALMKTEGHWNYFVTLTCNDSRTFGVAPLRSAIERFAYENSMDVSLILQNYSVLLTRAWERTVHYTWQYITTSPEHPLGRVKSSWMRYEFQSAGALGNRPHVHGGLTLHAEPMQDTLKRVRCSNTTMWSAAAGTDFNTLKTNGIINNHIDYSSLIDLCMTLQQHDCTKANQRCMKRKAADDTFICRVPRHPPSFQYTFEERNNLYDENTCRRLAYLNLATRCSECRHHWRLNDDLRGGIWHYPAYEDEHFVPTVPRLFVMMQSSTNVQVCDRKFQVSYLAKYAAGQEENRQVSVSHADQSDEVNVQCHDIINMKISGQALHPLNNRDFTLGREIALTEMIWYCLNFPFVVSSVDYVHASTKPPEYRAVVLKRRNNRPRPVDGGGGMPKTVADRLYFQQWRRFTKTQIETISNYEAGRFYLDRTSSFSVRPPELLLISKLELYLRWFVWRKDPTAKIENRVEDSSWIDGTNRCVRIRYAHFPDVVQYVNDLRQSSSPQVAAAAVDLFVFILGPLQLDFKNGNENSVRFQRFVDMSSKKRNVVVFPSPTPSYLPNFVIHILLTFGKFATECDLYDRGTISDAYRAAGLISDHKMTEMEMKCLVRKYVQEQLLWLPIGTRTFSRRLSEIMDGFSQVFLSGAMEHFSMPSTSETAMRETTIRQIYETETLLRNTAIDVLSEENIPHFPDSELLKDCQVEYVPIVIRANDQSDVSFMEQQSALETCIASIDAVLLETQPSPIVLVGPPGCGKTHILLIVFTYCLSKNLNCVLTAITSERARKLGGQHVHMLLGIPVEQGHIYTVQSWASKTLVYLAKKPIQLALLQRLRVIFFEEFSLLSAELLAVMDIVLRAVKGSDKCFGGVLMIATGDPFQLPPITGRPVWDSHHLMTSFRIVNMCHYVRARSDIDLQRVIEILRTVQPTELQIQEFVDIIRRRCLQHNCVSSWNEVPRNVLRIVGTRQACEEIIQQYIVHFRHQNCVPKMTSVAYDEAESGSGTWSKASEATQRALSKQCLEERTLFLHVGQILRLTYNNKQSSPTMPQFSQGQCCVVQRLPTSSCNKLWLKLVPPGKRDFNPDNLPNGPGWEEFSLKPMPSHECIIGVGRTKARRHQYRVAYYVCSTVHRALGDTCSAIATQISVDEHKFRLWQRQQLLVVLSRVRSLSDLLFVTSDSTDTLLAMLKLLHQRVPVVSQILSTLDVSENHPRVLDADIPIFRSPLPISESGYVYMLVSTTFPTFAYVGETKSISRRLIEHNSGNGSKFTNQPHLMPWTCLVLIYRFPGMGSDESNIAARKYFEAQWHSLNGRDHNPDTRSILLNGEIIFRRLSRLNSNLVWQSFGEIECPR